MTKISGLDASFCNVKGIHVSHSIVMNPEDALLWFLISLQFSLWLIFRIEKIKLSCC
jgi:hypothetical protein